MHRVGVALVTGGPGFIGSHVARALLQRGDDVRVTVRASSRLDNLEGLDVERVQCDLLDHRQVRFGLPYVTAMHEAEGEALRLAVRGLPVVTVNPTYVLGRGDVYRSSTEIVRRFLRREIPVYVYVDGTVNAVAVEDVAAGHLLADAHGKMGERYLLGNRNFTLDRLFADLGRLSGVEPPAVKLPLSAAIVLSPLPGVPGVREAELRSMGLCWAYRSTKAKRVLGWSPGPHEECLEQTIAWYRDHGQVRLAGTRQPLALRVAGAGLRRAESLLTRLP